MALASGFEKRYPNDWLVWEPGEWRVPGPTADLATTQLPMGSAPERPPKGDCLCYELKSATGKISIGRAPENDIVLNDATVSREHLLLERSGTAWLANVMPASRATKFSVKGAPPSADGPMTLSSGDKITLGGVTLTYLSVAGLKERLKAEAAKLLT